MIKQAEYYGRAAYIDAGSSVTYGLSLGQCRRWRTMILGGANLAAVTLPSPTNFRTGGPILVFVNTSPNAVSVSKAGGSAFMTIPAGAKGQIFVPNNSVDSGRFIGRSVGAPSVPSTIDDPLLYYTNDSADVSGATITDRGSGGNNGTLVNSPGSVAGHTGEALSFNGTNQSINSGHATNLDVTTFTLACWFKATSVPSAGSGGGSRWFFGKDTNTGRSFAYGINYDFSHNLAALQIQINGTNYGGSSVGAGTAITVDGLWHHATLTYDGTNVVYYLDGVPDGSAAGATPAATATDLLIGARGYPSFEGRFAGSLDEVRIYDRALSASEVTDLYNFTGAPVVSPIRSFTRLSRPSLLVPSTFTPPAISCLLAKYVLVNCSDETDVVFTNANLSTVVGKVIVTYQFPDTCYLVGTWDDIALTDPIPIAVATDDVGKAMVYDDCTECLTPDCFSFDDPGLPERLQWTNYNELFLDQAHSDGVITGFNPAVDRLWTGGFVLDRSGNQNPAVYVGDRFNDGTQPTKIGRGLMTTCMPSHFFFYPTGTVYFVEMPTISCRTNYTPPGQPMGNYWILSVQGSGVGNVYMAYKRMNGKKLSGSFTPFDATGTMGFNQGGGPYFPAAATMEVIE